MHELPLALLAELTHRCPLACPYCYNPTELVKRGNEMPAAQWKEVLSQAAHMGVLQVHFSGGEPLAYPQIEALVKYAQEVGLYSNLITSGIAAPGRIHRLAQSGLQHVQISLQDVDEAEADRIAGLGGAYARKRAAIDEIHSSGLPLTLNVVIHRANIGRVAAIIRLAQELGAQRLELAHVQYYGWALTNWNQLFPEREQLEAAITIVEAEKSRLTGIMRIDHVFPDYHARRPKACMGGWGRRFIVIAPDGCVLPCHAARTLPDMQFEQVGARNLMDIWNDGAAFTRFRGTDWMPEPCSSCTRREIDFGGCRCQAFALTGDPEATDPVCELSSAHGRLTQRDDSIAIGDFNYRSNPGK